MPEHLVVDASVLVDLLAETGRGPAVAARLRDAVLHAPAHLDIEVMSVLGRMCRDRRLSADRVAARLAWLAQAPIQRHPLAPLLSGAWKRRHRLRLADALYAELATRLGALLVTSDAGLAAAFDGSELVSGNP
jgi:predicted nucleic acid-binding protein